MQRFGLGILLLLLLLLSVGLAQMDMADSTDMDMMMTPVTDEYTFIAGMIPHHQEAVDTALEILVRSHRPEMQAFAWDIIKVQTEEIALMNQWLDSYHPGATTVMYMPMMREQAGLNAHDLDQFFLEDMVPHHQMAVQMSEELLDNDYAQNPGVAELAQSIIDTQTHEIMMMSAWLKQWYDIEAMQMDMGN